MHSSLLRCLLGACLVVPAAAPARADCDSDVARLRLHVAQIADPAAHARYIELVGAAVRQLMEGDEEACRRAVEATTTAPDAPDQALPAAAPAPSPPPGNPGPPPRLVGTAIGPSLRIAIFAGADGTAVAVPEGESVGGYTVRAIRPAEVDAVGGGMVQTLHVGLGGDGMPPAPAPPPPPSRGHRQGTEQHDE